MALVELSNTDRTTLALIFAEQGFKVGAEIGVEQGAYSEVLLQSNPGLHLHCIDPWLAYPNYREHVSQEKLDGFFASTQLRLQSFNVTYLRATSMDAVRQFSPNSLDFVYIDANHTAPYVLEDLTEWSKIVRPGGIISGHDYRKHKPGRYQCAVVEVVDKFTLDHNIDPWFVLGSKRKVNGEKRDTSRSYFWYKP